MEIICPKKNQGKSCTATIGFFDGVHLGHRFVIEQLKNAARNSDTPSLLITFGTHPYKTLQPGFMPKLLTVLPEKLHLLENTGIDACAVLDFNSQTAKMPAYDFMKCVLKEQYNVGTLLVGYDHRFGYKREETFLDYVRHGEKLGIQVMQLDRFSTDRTEHISSSEIRKLLQNGQIQQANNMLGYDYFFEGKVVDGFKVGRKIGFPTANLELTDKEKLLPSSGVYAVKVSVDNKIYPGMLNIGCRPTLENGDQISTEVHIISFNKDIYNRTIEVRFVHKIRDEKKFANVAELIAQLKKDKEQVLELMPLA